MAYPWFRLYSEFADDPKVQTMPECMQRRLVIIFCYQSGNVLETLHETELAVAMRISETELAETKRLFISRKFIDENWKILKWGQRQYHSDSSTERVQRHRAKKKLQQNGNVSGTLRKPPRNVSETPQITDTDIKTKAASSRTSKSMEPPLPPQDVQVAMGILRSFPGAVVDLPELDTEIAAECLRIAKGSLDLLENGIRNMYHAGKRPSQSWAYFPKVLKPFIAKAIGKTG